MHLDAALAEAQLSLSRAWTLWCLVREGKPLPLRMLAEHMGFAKSNVTYLIDRLEADGLVRRVPDPHDRRVALAELTEKGQQHYEKGIQIMQAVEAQLLEQYTPEERELFIRMLMRLNTVWS